MELGLFMMPLHPARPVVDAYQEDTEKLILADKLGFTEAWVGQHFTAGTEPIVSPLMFMAGVLSRTKQIKFATGVLNLPCFFPGHVAAEVAQFDHMSRGRFIFGIGPGALATDFQLFNNPDGRVREEKTIESIEMIKKIWASDPPYRIEGKYWSVIVEEGINAEMGTGYMLKPFQQPHPPIAISIMSPFSGTAKRAGQEGWEPISANFIPTYSVASHWKKFQEGADAAGRKVDASSWRVARNVVVAPTDEEAREIAYGEKSSLAYYYDYLWKALSLGNYTIAMKPDPKMADKDVTLPMLMDEMIIYGSPKTAAEKIVAFREKVGPFGKLVLAMADWEKDRVREERSMRMLANDVAPLLSKAFDGAKAA